MKTPKEWINEITESHGHDLSCICERCKNGREAFLIERDISEIQSDARVGYSKDDSLNELRYCIAFLREALSNTYQGQPLDAADLLNKTTETAFKFRCYLNEITEIRPMTDWEKEATDEFIDSMFK